MSKSYSALPFLKGDDASLTIGHKSKLYGTLSFLKGEVIGFDLA
jgi:hypothetical protein